MKHAATRELFSYWSRLRAQRAAPERADIDPAAIRKLLADTFILEFGGDGAFPMRVVGARISAIFGRELKGDDFLSLWREDERPGLRDLIGAVLDETLPAIVGAATSPRGRTRIELEVLLLPLRYNGRTHSRLLGALSPGATPTWLGLLSAAPMIVTSSRMIGVEESRTRQNGFETPAAGEWLPATTPVRAGHFRVYQGGR